MPRTLKAITGERPRCQYCDKPLRPTTDTIEVFGHLDEAPDQETLPSLDSSHLSLREGKYLVERGYRRDRVFRLTHRTGYAGRSITGLSFWRGTYHGYGTGQDGTRLICSYPCGAHFGVACWNAGMRIRREQ
jgi:hypothetical protein